MAIKIVFKIIRDAFCLVGIRCFPAIFESYNKRLVIRETTVILSEKEYVVAPDALVKPTSKMYVQQSSGNVPRNVIPVSCVKVMSVSFEDLR